MLRVRISIWAGCTTLCAKVCQWLATGRWFSPGPPVSSTNKTDRHDMHNWNIVESGVKHHNSSPQLIEHTHTQKDHNVFRCKFQALIWHKIVSMLNRFIGSQHPPLFSKIIWSSVSLQIHVYNRTIINKIIFTSTQEDQHYHKKWTNTWTAQQHGQWNDHI